MRNVSINEEPDITYVDISGERHITYEFATFEEAIEALPNLNELQQE